MRWLVGLAFVLVASSVASAPAPHANSVGNESFSFPLPDGYRDITNDPRLKEYPRKQVTVEAIAETMGYKPTITVFLAPDPGGTLGDAKLCRDSAANFAGPDGKVRGAAMIPGPRGTVCQMHVVLPQGVALMTELISFTETWLMATCNHADGDQQAEKGLPRDARRLQVQGARDTGEGRSAASGRPGVRRLSPEVPRLHLVALLQDAGVGARVRVEAGRREPEEAAATDDGRKTLPGVCATMLAKAKSAVAGVNCEW